jgi:hypothetical protein
MPVHSSTFHCGGSAHVLLSLRGRADGRAPLLMPPGVAARWVLLRACPVRANGNVLCPRLRGAPACYAVRLYKSFVAT